MAFLNATRTNFRIIQRNILSLTTVIHVERDVVRGREHRVGSSESLIMSETKNYKTKPPHFPLVLQCLSESFVKQNSGSGMLRSSYQHGDPRPYALREYALPDATPQLLANTAER